MNARTCQLCGKPLSRLRVGADGDFCSKEHRNQFRLRAGMDRLVEVNKVANLMRRRESAKQIPTSVLQRPGPASRRPFADAQPPRIDPTPRMIELRPPESTRPRISSYRDRCIDQRPAPTKGDRPVSRTLIGAIHIVPQEPRPVVPERAHRMTVAFPQNPPAAIPSLSVHGARTHRDYTLLPPGPIRSHLGDGPRALRQHNRASLAAAARLQSFRAKPLEGNALRVSIALAFRVPAVRQPRRHSILSAVSKLKPVERTRALPSKYLDCGTTQRPLLVNRNEIAPAIPLPPKGMRVNGLVARGTRAYQGPEIRNSQAPGPRSTELPWMLGEPRQRVARLNQTAAGFARRNGAHLFPITVPPNTIETLPQVDELPFVASEEYCVPKIPFRNVLAAAMAPANAPAEDAPAILPASLPPSPPPVPAPIAVAEPPAEAVRHEDHFDNGWDNWVGGVEDWKVDVAGCRIGSLAIFLPTLDMDDYDLEFLARIDTRTVNWVVRASGGETHLRCTLSATEGGQLEFSRAVVQAGKAETAVTSSQRVPGKPRKAMTVRMSVAGPVFSVCVDGKTIDSWVDDRLATGGVGFMGVPDDRARLYWVRVSTPGSSAKEHTIQ